MIIELLDQIWVVGTVFVVVQAEIHVEKRYHAILQYQRNSSIKQVYIYIYIYIYISSQFKLMNTTKLTHLSNSGTNWAGLGFCAMASSNDMPGHSTGAA